MTDAELGAWLRLTLTPGVGRASARKLLAAFGGPEQVFRQTGPAWEAVVGPKLAAALQQPPAEWAEQCERTRQWLAADPRHHLLALGDADYPADLLQTADPPLLLYLLGQRTALQHAHKLAIVGSRNPTPQGAENAAQFAKALAGSGLCVVSGLALGVDGAAHQGALDGGGPTLAVVGTGLDRVYPKRHLGLAHRIADQGALLSEYPLGTPPLAPHFPQRNRLIAGLSQGTLVVEAALQSGSLITAQLAADMGREVFAIPGSIHAPQSRGCHALIRQGAKLVESAQDILEDLHLDHAATPTAGSASVASDDPLLQALGFDPVGLDALQARTGLDTPTLQAQLLSLELDGTVQRLPGGLFQRVGLG
ncbi:DNA-processing protein DprA [Macromonas nakdongensis]|uniref:DNA-processing protein DprA n=1 Tax=Macromonas nakdongensis TaxID=1843082 RepID=UPI000C33B2E2|nr:DNA-processing protein DprA [Macromonas nakdongensis]